MSKLKRKNGQKSGRSLQGKVLVMDSIFFDHLLYGKGQNLEDSNALFADPARIKQSRNLCNLEKVGEFGKAQFNMHRMGVMYTSDGAGLTSTERLAVARALTYYSRIEIEIEGTRKQQIFVDQAGAGGGLNTTIALDASETAADVSDISNGLPSEQNQFTFRRSVPFRPGESFVFRQKFMGELVGHDAADLPLALVNADETSHRLYRVMVRGIFGRPLDQ